MILNAEIAIVALCTIALVAGPIRLASKGAGRGRPRRQKKKPFVSHWLHCEILEDRALPSSTLFNQMGFVVQIRNNPLLGAAPIAIQRDGVVVDWGNQVAFQADATGAGTDLREFYVIDTNGLQRLRHFDVSAAPGKEDPFGTSVKLPLGLIADNGAGGQDFFLSAEVQSLNVLTNSVAAGRFTLVITGKPADGPTALPHHTAPVLVQWTVSLWPPQGESTLAVIQTTATFQQQITLSASHLTNAEAFRVLEFSSSNVPDSNTLPPLPATHDADQLRIFDKQGNPLANRDLGSQPPNTLFFPGGLPLDGWSELNQVSPAPLNNDPPNLAAQILPSPDNPEYRAQGYKTVDLTINENSDNLATWISRTLASPTIPSGTTFTWAVKVTASDDIPVVPTKDLFADLGPNGLWRWRSSGGWEQLTPYNPEDLAVADSGALFADLGPYGIWGWSPTGGWQFLSPVNSEALAVAGNGDLFADLGPYGLWRLASSRVWSQLTSANPEDLVALGTPGNGDLFADFGAAGLWRWNDAGWRSLTPVNPAGLALAESGDLYVDLNLYGVWHWTLAGWQFLSGVNPEDLAVADDGTLYADLGSYGLWAWAPTAPWQQLTPVNSENLVVGGNGDLFADLGPFGLWRRPSNDVWTQLTPVNPEDLTASDDSGLFADLGLYGLWTWRTPSGWALLSPFNPESLGVARNGNHN